MSIDVTLIGAILAVLTAIAGGHLRSNWAPAASAAAAAVMAAAIVALWRTAGSAPFLDLAWVPSLGSRVVLATDPLGATLAVFTAALAAPVLAFTAGYLPPHLKQRDRPLEDQARFCRLMLAFAGSMVLLMLAQDLLLIFAALELTALVSFLLIEFDREDPKARQAAMLALVATAGSSLLFIVGALMIAARTGTTVLGELAASGAEIPTAAAVCLALGVLAKSAQVPLHFWLPRAMVAPTPVSAYLHSAALVAAGVFVLARLRVLLATSPELMTALGAVGLASIILGGLLALVADDLKRILAYSTIAQYGYGVVLLAVGGAEGAAGAAFFFVAHGLCKCALFMTAGAVSTATGYERLSDTGGLLRRFPTLAVASAIAAAGLAGLPATIGYFKDELFFAATAHHGPWLGMASVLAAALTLAYTGRFWLGIFAGREPSAPAPVEAARQREMLRPSSPLIWPVMLLSACVLVLGIRPGPLEPVFESAGAVIRGEPAPVTLAYHLESRAELWMALAAWVGGLALVTTRARWQPRLHHVFEGPVSWWTSAQPAARAADGVRRLTDRLHELEVRDLRDHISSVLLPTAALVGLALIAQRQWPGWGEGIGSDDLVIVGGLAVTAGAALAVPRASHYVTLVLVLSFAGFGLGLTFAVAGAPDVALVIVVVETQLTILLLALLRQLRPDAVRHVPHAAQGQPRRWWIGPLAGAAMFVVAWFVLAMPRPTALERAHIRLAESAHASDVVTVILADFRGLDTAGEITVFAVAVLGAAAIAWGKGR